MKPPALVLALTGLRAEGDVVRALSGGKAPATIARRVTDVVGLLAVCRAGLADGALIAPGFPGLDRAVVQGIRQAGVPCWGLVDPGDDDADQTLRAWGIPVAAVPADAAGAIRALLAEPGQPPAAAPAPGPIVVVTGPAGAPGRSTVALNLAAEHPRSVLLIDADLTAPSLAFSLGVSTGTGGILAACRAASQAALASEALLALAQPASGGIRLLSGIAEPRRIVELGEFAFPALWQAAARCGLPVVVDAGPFPAGAPQAEALLTSAMAVASSVVVVARPTALSIHRLMNGYADLAAGTSAEMALVWNAARRGLGPLAGDPLQRLTPVHRALRPGAVAGLPEDPRAAAQLDAGAGPLRECAPRSPLRRALATFSGALLAETARSA